MRGPSEAIARAPRAAALTWCPLMLQIHEHAARCAGEVLPVREGSVGFQVVPLSDSRLKHTSPCRVARGLGRNHSVEARLWAGRGGRGPGCGWNVTGGRWGVAGWWNGSELVVHVGAGGLGCKRANVGRVFRRVALNGALCGQE